MAVLAECPVCHRKQAVKNKVCTCGQDLDKAKRIKKKVRYWIRYRLPEGKQRLEFAGFSVEDARTADGKRRAQKYETPRILQKVPEEKMTFNQLTEWYTGLEKVKARAYFPTLKINLASFNAELGHFTVSQLRPADIESYQAKRKAAGYSDSYVDQEVGAARTMINKAFDNDLVSGETVKVFRKVKKLLKRNANTRDKVLTLDQFEALMQQLPIHTKAILAAGFFTGMRKAEILNLTWDRVNLKDRMIRLEPGDTKDREPRLVPICDELYAILRALRRGSRSRHVFLFKGKAVNDIRAGLKDACKAAGIAYGRSVKGGFVFHDLRHTFNTNMRKAGVPESVIMEITGHATREMFDRYNTVDRDDARQAVAKMEDYLARATRRAPQTVH